MKYIQGSIDEFIKTEKVLSFCEIVIEKTLSEAF